MAGYKGISRPRNRSDPCVQRDRAAGSIAWAAAVSVAVAAAAAPACPPSIVIIHADDLGWSDLGCQGNAAFVTPAIDSLTREGMRFTQAYAAGPVCTPSRAALLTGRWPARLHMTGQPGYLAEIEAREMIQPRFSVDLPPTVPTVANTLAAAGYTSICMGKWGVGGDPNRHGFILEQAATEDGLTDAAERFIAASRDRPFLLYFNPARPHVPLAPDPALAARHRERLRNQELAGNPDYTATVEELDRAVGRILAALDRAGIAESTVVIFTSDNGGFLGYDDVLITTNSPLKEGKASLYEGGIRVPLIVRWPGFVPPGSTSDIPVHGVDFHATLADLAGVARERRSDGDGRSFLSLLRGTGAIPARPLFWHYPHYRRSKPGLQASPSAAVRDGGWKLIHFFTTGHDELYQLDADPGESRNLAPIEAGKAAELRARLDGWLGSVDAQLPQPKLTPSLSR